MVCGEGLKLQALREERGVSLCDVGDRLDVSGATVLRWEHGRSTPRVGWDVVLRAVESMKLTARKIAWFRLSAWERQIRLLQRFIKAARVVLRSAAEMEDDYEIVVDVDCVREALETAVEELLKRRASVSPDVAGASGR